jgi:hypothetical protein
MLSRTTLVALGAAGLCTVAVGIPSVVAAPPHKLKHRNVHFTDVVDGASLSATEAVLKVHDSVAGDGAAVQKITSLSATAGTDVTHNYYKNASAVSHDSFTLSAPDADGVISVTGHGKDVSGTGLFRHIRSTYTFTGTFNTKTGINHTEVAGTESY